MVEKPTKLGKASACEEVPRDGYRAETMEMLAAYRSISDDRVRAALKEFIEVIVSKEQLG